MNNHYAKSLFILMLSILLAACGAGGNQPQADEGEKSLQPNQLQGSPEPMTTPKQAESKRDNQSANTSNSTSSKSTKQQSQRQMQVRNDIRGIYVTAEALANDKKRKELINLIETTELNAMVIDAKGDYGTLTYQTKNPAIEPYQAAKKPPLQNIQQTLQELKEKNIYTIARIVVFKDPNLADMKPSYAMQRKTGGVWRDGSDTAWVDPYRPEVRKYNISIAKEVAQLGFDEIQFDYVRFPENGRKVNREVKFYTEQGAEPVSKAELIASFLQQATEDLHQIPIRVSADVFGLTTTQKDDMGIGQKWLLFADKVDVVSPMIYPSHYTEGTYGIAQPDLKPKPLISQATKDAIAQNKLLQQAGRKPAELRPWLQSFTASWLEPHRTYDAQAVQEQIQALKDLGIEQYLLWNPSSDYTL